MKPVGMQKSRCYQTPVFFFNKYLVNVEFESFIKIPVPESLPGKENGDNDNKNADCRHNCCRDLRATNLTEKKKSRKTGL
jgi:hypothetical protein